MLQTWQQFLVEKSGETHKFSCTMVIVPKEIGNKIIQWGKTNIPDSEIHTDPDGGKGRETESHITLLYGIHSDEPSGTIKALKGESLPKITLGKTSIFSNAPGFDVVKVSVISPELNKLNALLRNKVEFTNKYEYIPHLTIAYVKKGKGEQYANDSTFAGIKFIPEKIIFGGSNGKKADIKLGEGT